MITKIEVNGFKSLSNFSLLLKSGLNILVGPNGSGKTNVISFFEFLAELNTNTVANSVSSLGGAGALFRKIGNNDYQRDIWFKIYGSFQSESQCVSYEYEAKITTSFEKDSLYYSYQKLKYKKGSKIWFDPEAHGYNNSQWDFEFESNYSGDDNPPTISSYIKVKKLKIEPYGIKGKKEVIKFIERLVADNNPSSRSLPSCLIYIMDFTFFKIHSELKGGESFNIEPRKVKESEDAATPPGINKDGSGLATTLYAIKKRRAKISKPSRLAFYEPEDHYDPNTLNKIISYLQLANSTIKQLEITNDPFNNKLIIKLFIDVEGEVAALPLSAMSDGTIKWLTIITAIFTSRNIFSIEEPENFLHPWMQAEITSLLREHLADRKEPSFVLLTTHSESLINKSFPEEIILLENRNGNTIASRVSNKEKLIEEISKTGFGLGHYYFSNALE